MLINRFMMAKHAHRFTEINFEAAFSVLNFSIISYPRRILGGYHLLLFDLNG